MTASAGGGAVTCLAFRRDIKAIAASKFPLIFTKLEGVGGQNN
jgi:hypothetical protein